MKKLYYTEDEKRQAKNRWNRTYVKHNHEKAKQWSRESYHRRKEANIKKHLLKYAKSRAIKKNIPFDITEEDLFIPEECPIFKVPFILSDPKYSPSIDRIIPKLGYTKENIQIISSLANKMKWDSNQEELLSFCKGMILFLEGGNRP